MPKSADVISAFLAENQQFVKVEWLPGHGDLTVRFKDNPGEPFSINEFIRYTPTWLLLEKLIDDLEECDGEDA